MQLVDMHGKPLSSSDFAKVSPPQLGEKFAPRWANEWDNRIIRNMPGYGAVQFDLTKLQLADFRTMRDHYQINAALGVMSFMMHQIDWKIECSDPKIQAFVQDNMEQMWTNIIKACSQAHWAGYAPCVLQWENDPGSGRVRLTKIKDLIPETSLVNWKMVDGYAPPGRIPPKIAVYDGIRVWGQDWPIPSENTFWYPLLMENGDMYGRKLLRAAFTSWYFSLLIHMFANRYFERFGEPVPVGRAPYDEEITMNIDGTPKKINGAQLMLNVLQSLRNRSAVVLPNDRTQVGTGSAGKGVEYDFDIQYLESQMRGADFERYLMRLDEEMSLAMFTPLLVLRTADVGSYNLGSTHWVTYQNMLNALAADMKTFIDAFILSRMVDFNFGANAARATITFRKMGSDKMPLITAIMQALIPTGRVMPDLQELGDIAGLSFEEVQVLTGNDPQADTGGTGKPADPQKTAKAGGTPKKTGSSGGTGKAAKKTVNASLVVGDIAKRVATQIRKRITDGSADFTGLSFGYEKALVEALTSDDVDDSPSVRAAMYALADAFLADASGVVLGMTQSELEAYLERTLGICLEMQLEEEDEAA